MTEMILSHTLLPVFFFVIVNCLETKNSSGKIYGSSNETCKAQWMSSFHRLVTKLRDRKSNMTEFGRH